MERQQASRDRHTFPGIHRRDFVKRAAHAAVAVGGLPAALAWTRCGAAAQNGSPPIIDTHMHVWANDARRYPFPHPYNKALEEVYRKTSDAVGTEETEEEMGEHDRQEEPVNAFLLRRLRPILSEVMSICDLERLEEQMAGSGESMLFPVSTSTVTTASDAGTAVPPSKTKISTSAEPRSTPSSALFLGDAKRRVVL